jgi:hypothetical protein
MIGPAIGNVIFAALRDRGFDRRVDVRELSIPIRISGALSRLAIGLATVVQLTRQIAQRFPAPPESGWRYLPETRLALCQL